MQLRLPGLGAGRCVRGWNGCPSFPSLRGINRVRSPMPGLLDAANVMARCRIFIFFVGFIRFGIGITSIASRIYFEVQIWKMKTVVLYFACEPWRRASRIAIGRTSRQLTHRWDFKTCGRQVFITTKPVSPSLWTVILLFLLQCVCPFDGVDSHPDEPISLCVMCWESILRTTMGYSSLPSQSPPPFSFSSRTVGMGEVIHYLPQGT